MEGINSYDNYYYYGGGGGGGHVVVLPYPSQGHMNPLLQFAKRLASKGVKATFATTHYTIKSVLSVEKFGVGTEPISDGFDAGGFAQAGNEDVYLRSYRDNGSRTLSQIVRKFQQTDSPVTCVVYDSFLPWALDVAKKYGIQGAAFFTNSAAVSSIFCRIHRRTLELPVKMEDMPLVLPGLPPLNFPDLPSFIKAPDSHPAYLAMKLSQFSNLDNADWVFDNSFQELEGQTADCISEFWPAKLIGPMVPSAYLDGQIEDDRVYGASLWKPLTEECISWLKTKPLKSVVYVSFGSMVSLKTEQVAEIAWGLKKSDFYFLWVLRESEREKLPVKFIDSVQEKGMIVTWCNQLEILNHGAIGCFVTHCGWNSTLEGLSLGVPMVAMPQWADQLTDAKFIDEIWGVGVRAEEDENGIATRNEVESCLKQVMEGETSYEIRRNASKFRVLAKEAISRGGSSDRCIDEFVEQLRSICSRK